VVPPSLMTDPFDDPAAVTHAARLDAWEQSFAALIQGHLDRAERVAVEKLGGSKIAGDRAKAAAAGQVKRVKVTSIFNPVTWLRTLTVDAVKWLLGIYGDVGGSVSKRIGGRPFDPNHPDVLDAVNGQASRLAGLADYLAALLDRALDEGADDDPDGLADRVREAFGKAKGRVGVIAGTETGAAGDTAGYLAGKQAGVPVTKVWWTRLDGRVRTTPAGGHLAAHGQARDLDVPFDVAGEALMFPHDPKGSPWNTIGCRCIGWIVPVLGQPPVAKPVATIKTGRRALIVQTKEAADGDGDGFIFDGTPGMRPVGPTPKRLSIKPHGKRISEKQALAAADKITVDVGRFYGSTKPAPMIMVMSEVETARVMQSSRGDDVFMAINPSFVDKMRDPEGGIAEFRVVAHEAIHHHVSGTPNGPLPGISHTIEEGAAEVLSVGYWLAHGQPFGEDDAVRLAGKWRGGNVALIGRSVYDDKVSELITRAASRVGWDRKAVFADILAAMQGDHNVRLAFRDSSNPDFPRPDGVAPRPPNPDEDPDKALIAWLFDVDMPAETKAAPRDGDGDGWIYDGTPRMQPRTAVATLPRPLTAAPPVRTVPWEGRGTILIRSLVDEHDQRSLDALNEAARLAYEGPVGNTGITSRIDWSMSPEYLDLDDGETGGLIVEYGGHLYDETGEEVGKWTRTWKATGEVHHDYVSLYDEMQGRGFAAEWNAQAEAVYARMGMTHITLTANLSVGGYAWAAAGWDFAATGDYLDARGDLAGFPGALAVDNAAPMRDDYPDSDNPVPQTRGGWLDRFARDYRLDRTTLEAMFDPDTVATFAEMNANPKVRPIDYAAVGRTQTVRNADGREMWAGKVLLLASQWWGSKPVGRREVKAAGGDQYARWCRMHATLGNADDPMFPLGSPPLHQGAERSDYPLHHREVNGGTEWLPTP
jgi:hypothetical protein